MFSLASAIEKKKRQLADPSVPAAKRQKKYRSRREIEEEKERERELVEQAQRESLEKEKQIQEEATPTTEEDSQTDTRDEEKPQYEREEVIKRLRQAGLVVTYFGETDRERERRWLKFDTESKEDFAFNKGTKNEFDDLMRNIDSNTQDDEEESGTSNQANDEFLQKPIERIFDGLQLCDEDRCLLLFRRLLEEWKLDTKANEEELRRTMQGKKLLATVKQSEIYLRPLFKALKQRNLAQDILSNLIEVGNAVVSRNYTEAGNFYIQMAVGNAPWPIGVTMVGIHERSAREKIFSNQVAHVLNDETQRKYIQSVYRLIKFCQKKYPATPSRSIG